MPRLQVFIAVGNRFLFFSFFEVASPAFGGLTMTEGVSQVCNDF